MEDPASPACQAFLAQMSAFSAFHGCQPDFAENGSEHGVGRVAFTLDANSMWLNEFTDVFVDGCQEIAADIDPDDAELNRIVETIRSQLSAQLVPVSGDGVVTIARPGREGLQRIEGEASFLVLIDELEVHTERVRNNLTQLLSVSGVDSWRQRIHLRWMAAIDAGALIRSARRLERVAQQMRCLIPGEHLDLVHASFIGDTKGLIDLRDIAEHVDEYAIGRGRRDPPGEQPGAVFEYSITNEDIIVSARDHSLSVLHIAERSFRLGRCLKAASDHHPFHVLFPNGLDMDFMEEGSDGGMAYVEREAETAEQREARAVWESVRNAPSASGTQETEDHVCPECGRAL